jgi:hypothetical protein
MSMLESNLKRFECNDCLNSQHGCIKKITGKNPCQGGILEKDLVTTEENGVLKKKVPEHLIHKCEGRKKIPWFKKPKNKKEKQKAA